LVQASLSTAFLAPYAKKKLTLSDFLWQTVQKAKAGPRQLMAFFKSINKFQSKAK
jgi:hypothetical protein